MKTVTYAFLYGAGNEKIGTSYDSSLNSSSAKSKGKEIREAFVAAIDGLDSLLDAIKHSSECGCVRLLMDAQLRLTHLTRRSTTSCRALLE